MNFFQDQARAKAQSRRLMIGFLLSVLVTVAAIDAVVLFALGLLGTEPEQGPAIDPLTAVLVSSAVVLAVIGVASLFKIATLASGGAAVARSVGAVPLPPESGNPSHRRLRNVVEEIAIASGVPVPQIFVLEAEAGINAFAAGYAPTDAAVTVTRGALDKLSRDELQGVIAHEFSHVINGDMRLNIRMMGLLFGLLALGVIGRKVLEHGPRARGSGRGGGAVFVIALGVMVLGYAGLLCGRLLKAGVSRSREYLADASAVQFTRQTVGLAGALKKAAGITAGTRLSGASGEEVAHMLFGDGVGFSGLFATHPPLADRIRRLDPSFQAGQLQAQALAWNAADYAPPDEAALTTVPLVDAASMAVDPAAVRAQVGRPGEDDYRAAQNLHETLPGIWASAVHEADAAVDVVLALLMHADPGVAAHQLSAVTTHWGGKAAERVRQLAAQSGLVQRAQRLPLLAMALPALNRLPRVQLQRLIATVDALVLADQHVEVFEYALSRLLRDQLAEVLAPGAAPVLGPLKLDQAESAVVNLLAILALHGNADATAARRAYLAGLQRVLPRSSAIYQPPADWTAALDAALRQLDRLRAPGKALLVEAMVAVLGADGRVTVAEAELLRAICAGLHLPLPPLLSDRAPM